MIAHSEDVDNVMMIKKRLILLCIEIRIRDFIWLLYHVGPLVRVHWGKG